MGIRYKHWMFTTRSKSQPAAIVCVEVDVTTHRPSAGPAVQTETLTRWLAVSAVRDQASYGNTKYTSGGTADGFWVALQRLVEKHAPVWVFCSRAPRVWSALGVWDYVERGRLLLGGISGQTGNRPVGKPIGSSHRLLVLEDPTNAIKLRIAGVPGSLTLVDLRNYGIDLTAEAYTTRDRRAAGFAFVTQMLAALDSGQLGALQVTVSSQSLFTYRYRFMTHSIHVHTHEKALSLEEDAYHGGRCEAYQIGRVEGQVHHLDYSSLYASLCLTQSVPCQLRHYAEFDPPAEAMSLRDELPDTADILVEVAEPYYPCARAGLVVYPTGTFRTVLTGPELVFALRRGHVQRIYRAAWYHKRPALRDFAVYFLARRADLKREGLVHLETWTKRMLVGLVGKLGQRGGGWTDCLGAPWQFPWDAYSVVHPDGDVVKYRVLAGHVQREEPALWGAESVPAIAAWITSAGRWHLTQTLAAAGWENCYYNDTDSVMTNDEGLRRLTDWTDLIGPAPGQLRLVETSEGADIGGWKSYHAGSKSALSGVPKGSLQRSGSPFYRWFTSWIPEALRQKRRPDARAKLLRVSSERPYRHGVVMANGRTRPFALPEELPLIKDC